MSKRNEFIEKTFLNPLRDELGLNYDNDDQETSEMIVQNRDQYYGIECFEEGDAYDCYLKEFIGDDVPVEFI
jgi:hypothetical protein